MNIIPIKIFITLFSLVILAINCNACKKEEDIIGAHRDVFDYYPKKDTLNVGDTMFFKITIPMSLNICTLIDANSIPIIYNMMLDMYGKRVDGIWIDSPWEPSLENERVVKIKGILTENKDIPSIFERVSNNYVLEFGYIFKYSGGGSIRNSTNYAEGNSVIFIDKSYHNCDKRIMLVNRADHNNSFGNRMNVSFFIKER